MTQGNERRKLTRPFFVAFSRGMRKLGKNIFSQFFAIYGKYLRLRAFSPLSSTWLVPQIVWYCRYEKEEISAPLTKGRRGEGLPLSRKTRNQKKEEEEKEGEKKKASRPTRLSSRGEEKEGKEEKQYPSSSFSFSSSFARSFHFSSSSSFSSLVHLQSEEATATVRKSTIFVFA